MNTRILLLSTILLLLSAGCSSEPEVAEVSGSTGTATESGSVFSEEGKTYLADWIDVSDDRVKGETEAIVFCEVISEEEEAAECEGTFMIVNDGGTWEGRYSGTTIQNVHDFQGTLIGTGDYEGLQFTYRLQGTEFPWDITGTIQPVND